MSILSKKSCDSASVAPPLFIGVWNLVVQVTQYHISNKAPVVQDIPPVIMYGKGQPSLLHITDLTAKPLVSCPALPKQRVQVACT